MPTLRESLGKRLRSLRESRGLNLKELADLLQTHHSSMCFYETGKRLPPIELMVPLARTLGVTTDYLLAGNDEGDGLLLDHEMHLVVRGLLALNPRDRGLVAGIIRLFARNGEEQTCEEIGSSNLFSGGV